MEDIFLIKLLLTFLVGSVWVIITTILAEKLGTKLGGLIGGLPSTVVVGLFFIGSTQSPSIAAEATTVIPLIMGVGAFFIVTFVLLARKNFYLGIFGSLSLWTLLSLGLVYLKPNFIVSIMGCLIFLVISYYVLEIKYNIKSVSKKKMKYTFNQILFRASLSGAIITLAVIMTKFGGPLMGGMFAAFPAVFLSTSIITHWVHGSAFSGAVMKVLMISGVLNVSVYAIVIRYLVVPLGIIWGSLVSFGISIVFAYGLSQVVNKKIS